jgi:thymidylate kinase
MVRCCACKSPVQINAHKAVARMKDDNGMQKDKFGCKTSSILARARAIYLVLGTENKNHKKTID